jgi:hypothetical protein
MISLEKAGANGFNPLLLCWVIHLKATLADGHLRGRNLKQALCEGLEEARRTAIQGIQAIDPWKRKGIHHDSAKR